MEGYGLYWYCLECVARNVDNHNLTFELEEDAELISADTGIHYERVEEMMRYMVTLSLFESSEGRITCLKLARRADEYTQKVLKNQSPMYLSRQTPDSVGTKSVLLEENRTEQKRIKKKKELPPLASLPTEIDVVFEHWKKTFGHPKAQLDDKRRKRIKARLKDYTEADLIASISGYLKSPHHMGENSNCTKYDSIDLFLRDAAHVDAGLAFTKGLVGTPDKAKKEAWDKVIASLKNSGAPRPTDPALVRAVKICGGWQAIGSANIENVLPRIKKQFMEVYGE